MKRYGKSFMVYTSNQEYKDIMEHKKIKQIKKKRGLSKHVVDLIQNDLSTNPN